MAPVHASLQNKADMSLSSPGTAMPSMAPQPGGSPSDRDLVSQYIQRRDEIAFATLVRRHSPLVFGVCERVLRHRQDVEDAFQATFLVLARDAHRVRKRASLASWLHGVAYRTSLRAAESRNRRIRLLQDVAMTQNNGNSLDDVAARHERQLLDEELAQLPEKYRGPLVLHYLEGMTARQVANDLKLSVSTVEGRLKRGRKELQLRLARRGIGVSVALAALSLTPSAVTAAELDALVGGTIHAGLSYSSGDPAGPLFTHEAARLAAQETIAMTTTTATAAFTAAILVPLAFSMASHEGTRVDGVEQQTPLIVTEEQAVGEDERIQVTQVSTESEQASGTVSESRLKVQARGGGRVRTNDSGRTDVKATEVTLDAITLYADQESGPVSRWHHLEQPETVQRIEAALGDPSQFEFTETPLSEVLHYIEEQQNFRLLLDVIALTDFGIATDEPVSLSVDGVKLESALNLILGPLQLDYIIRDEVLMVTTRDVADNTFETRVYDLRNFPQMTGDSIEEILEDSIPGASWKSDGGDGSIHMIDGGMVVTQTQRVHRQILALLQQLERHAAAASTKSGTFSQRRASSMQHSSELNETETSDDALQTGQDDRR